MKEIPQRLSTLRVWMALLLSAFLLCGCLTGCKGGHRSDNDETITTPPSTGVETATTNPMLTSSAQPDAQELWSAFKEGVEALKTYRDNHPEIHYPLAEGVNDSDPTPGYTGAVETLKLTVHDMPTTVPGAAELKEIIESIDGLLGRIPGANEAAQKANITLSPTAKELERLRKQAVNLQEALPQSETLDPSVEPSNEKEIETAKEEIKNAVNTAFDALHGDITGLETAITEGFQDLQKGLRTGVSPVVAAICSFFCLVAVLVGIFVVRSDVDQITRSMEEQLQSYSGEKSGVSSETADAIKHAEQAKETEQTGGIVQISADDMKTLQAYIAETQALREQLQQILEHIPPKGTPTETPPAVRKFQMFVWDKQKGLDELNSRDVNSPKEFSGEPTGALNEYRIWPDPRGLGEESLHSSGRINTNTLYFGCVKEFFDINPPSAGNYQAHSIQVKECAVIQKDYGTHYFLVKKGKIQATGVS